MSPPLQASNQIGRTSSDNGDPELSHSPATGAPNVSGKLETHKHEKRFTTIVSSSDLEVAKPKDSRILARLRGKGQKNQYSNRLSTSSSQLSLKGNKMKELSQDDVIIVLMGPTGSGKSTFINTVTNSNIAVGHNLESCTSEISTVRLPFPELVDTNIVFVDTPGFDHTGKTDIEILKMVADWLKATYENDILLSGLLYFHRISNTQMAGTSMKHLRIFEELCGKNALQNVVLVTTMWDEVDEDTGKIAEDKMKAKYWNKMLERNSTTGRFLGTRESAVGLLLPLIDAAHKRSSLLLQHEMVNMGKKLIETSAGRHLFAKAERIVYQRQEVIQRIQTEMRHPTRDRVLLEPLHDEHRELSQRLEQTIEEMRVLDLSVGRRFLETSERWFSRKLVIMKSVLMGMIKTQDETVDDMEDKASPLVSGSNRPSNEIPGERKPALDPNEADTMSIEAKRPSSGESFKKSPGKADELGEDQTEVGTSEAKNCSSSQSIKKSPIQANELGEDQTKVKTKGAKDSSSGQPFKNSPMQVDELGEDAMTLVMAGAIL